MTATITKRDFLKLAGVGGGAVFASSLPGFASSALAADKGEFYFVQLSDSHWGFMGDKINPDARGTLPKAIAAVKALPEKPDFIVFTGDITHTTDDDTERDKRMTEAKKIIADGLKGHQIHFLAGEHDAALDNGAAFKKHFGKTYYSFDHKGVHFIAIDNVSDPKAAIGEKQLAWLAADLKNVKKTQQIVVFTHRPLFDLAADWDWATPDGQQAIDMLMPFQHVTVFYGHIHQENHQMTGHIAHHAAKGLMFPLPAPHSVPKKAPIPWDASAPYKGLGFRGVEDQLKEAELEIIEFPVMKA